MSKGIFTETESQKVDIHERDADRDDLIEELYQTLIDMRAYFPIKTESKEYPLWCAALERMDRAILKAERAGYGL